MSFKGSNSYEKSRRTHATAAQSHSASSSSDLSGAFKLVMVGDSGVGKSCLLEKLVSGGGSKNAFISTIGVDVRTHQIDLSEGHSCKLQVWDTGGQQRYRPVLSTCYRNAHGVIVVFDVTNAVSFANLQQWIDEIAEFADKTKSPPPKLLVGNKCDLDSRREVETSRGEDFATKHGMSYMETSAIGATKNVREAFLELLQSADLSSAAGGSAAGADQLRKMMQKKSASTSS